MTTDAERVVDSDRERDQWEQQEARREEIAREERENDLRERMRISANLHRLDEDLAAERDVSLDEAVAAVKVVIGQPYIGWGSVGRGAVVSGSSERADVQTIREAIGGCLALHGYRDDCPACVAYAHAHAALDSLADALRTAEEREENVRGNLYLWGVGELDAVQALNAIRAALGSEAQEDGQ